VSADPVTSRSGNPNDAIRRHMLRYFYDRAQKARSKSGKQGHGAKISEVKADLKAKHGLTQPEVIANLEYLKDRGWVKEVSETKQVPTRAGMLVPSTTTYYQVSADGTDKIEGGSEFQQDRYAGINIEATGSNVITVGGGNYVNVAFEDVFHQLSELRRGIIESQSVPEDAKFSAAADIATLQDQLAKKEPDLTVAQRLWPGIEKSANLAGLAALGMEVAKALGVI
jgi:hypothetical protein